MRRLNLAVLCAPALALLARDALAQPAVSVRADNDAFNFWQAPWNRPDEEYTSGVRLTVDYAGRAPWVRGRRAAAGECGAGADACAEHSYAFGQDIYTGARNLAQQTPRRGSRPDAGILWLSASSRLVRAARVAEVRWTIGVTGKPALAEPMQRFFHGLIPAFNRPVDWAAQLPAEPVLAVSYDQRRRRTMGAVVLEPHAGVSVGNLLTEARAGMGARLGRSVRPGGSASTTRRPGWAFVSDVTVHGVVRNESLSGTFFRPSDRVTLRPTVVEAQAGVNVRWRGLGVSWIAHQTGAEYRARRGAHAWSTLEAAWWPRR